MLVLSNTQVTEKKIFYEKLSSTNIITQFVMFCQNNTDKLQNILSTFFDNQDGGINYEQRFI